MHGSRVKSAAAARTWHPAPGTPPLRSPAPLPAHPRPPLPRPPHPVPTAAGNFLSPAEQLSSNGFRTVLEIDTLGTFNMCRAAFAPLKAAGAGAAGGEGRWAIAEWRAAVTAAAARGPSSRETPAELACWCSSQLSEDVEPQAGRSNLAGRHEQSLSLPLVHSAPPPTHPATAGPAGTGPGALIINISMTLHYGATWWQAHASAAKAREAPTCTAGQGRCGGAAQVPHSPKHLPSPHAHLPLPPSCLL